MNAETLQPRAQINTTNDQGTFSRGMPYGCHITNTSISNSRSNELDYVITKRKSIGLGSSEHVTSLFPSRRTSVGLGTSEHVIAALNKRSSIGLAASEHVKSEVQWKRLASGFDHRSELLLKQEYFGWGASEHMRGDLRRKDETIGLGASEHIRADLEPRMGLGSSEHFRADFHEQRRSSIGLGASEHIRADIVTKGAMIGLGASAHMRGLGASEHVRGLGTSEHFRSLLPSYAKHLSFEFGLGASQHIRMQPPTTKLTASGSGLDANDFSLSEHSIAHFTGSKHRLSQESFHSRQVKQRLSELNASLRGVTDHQSRHESSGTVLTSKLLPLSSKHHFNENVDSDDDSDDEDEFGTDEGEFAGDSDSSSVIVDRKAASPEKRVKVDPTEVKLIMEAFNKAMEVSQKTQQDIHDWDRKMGLKRSHSKTMRLSSRSRKKLRSIMKKEISLLVARISV